MRPHGAGSPDAGPRSSRPVCPTPGSPSYAGAITEPAQDSEVKQCAYLSGSASFPDDQTLILAMQNLTNGDTTTYVEYVFGWEQATSALHTWQGAQYFGNADSSVGQTYRVTLYAVDQSAATAARSDDDAMNALPTRGVPLAAVDVHRIAGEGPNSYCPEP